MTDNSNTVFTVVTNTELAQAKADGKYPLAPITFLRSDKPDVNGALRVYYVEIISNLEAGWITKGNPNELIDQLELEELKHAMWAGVEVLYQHRNAVMEHGLHVLDVDMTKTPEREIGAVAAWCTNPQYVRFAPQDGWVSLKARNVGNGQIHYVVGDTLSNGQETKYDYEDMLVAQAANFRLFVPPFLDTPHTDENGHQTSTWIESVINALSLPREASLEASHKAAIKGVINRQAFQVAARQTANGVVPSDASLTVTDINGDPLDLTQIADGRIFVYANVLGSMTMIRTIVWDHSSQAKMANAKNLVNQYRQHRFSLSAL